MKRFAIQPQPTLQTNDGREKFSLLELFKMLMAAALCGIVFSLFAAGLTLLLMSSADAHMLHARQIPGVFSTNDAGDLIIERTSGGMVEAAEYSAARWRLGSFISYGIARHDGHFVGRAIFSNLGARRL